MIARAFRQRTSVESYFYFIGGFGSFLALFQCCRTLFTISQQRAGGLICVIRYSQNHESFVSENFRLGHRSIHEKRDISEKEDSRGVIRDDLVSNPRRS